MASSPHAAYRIEDADHSPLLVFYELTRACDLACAHCRACAQPRAHRHELSHAQSRSLIDQLAEFPRPPMLVLTGGDPLKRGDLFDVIDHAVSRGLATSVVPATTPKLSREVIERFARVGVSRLGVSIDGPDAVTHDRFRGVGGTFDVAMRALRDARESGLATQVNTTVGPHNHESIERMADLLEPEGIALWSLFFLVPVGRAREQVRLSPEQYERVFESLWVESRRRPFGLKTTEAPFYRRFVLRRSGDPQGTRAPLGINDGRGILFVSHTGHLYPSGFLPLQCGRFPEHSVIDVYQRHEVFQALRDPGRLGGKCGRCGYQQVCGGSRARAYAVHRDFLAAEPDCGYQPQLDTAGPGEEGTAAISGSSDTMVPGRLMMPGIVTHN